MERLGGRSPIAVVLLCLASVIVLFGCGRQVVSEEVMLVFQQIADAGAQVEYHPEFGIGDIRSRDIEAGFLVSDYTEDYREFILGRAGESEAGAVTTVVYSSPSRDVVHHLDASQRFWTITVFLESGEHLSISSMDYEDRELEEFVAPLLEALSSDGSSRP